MTPNIRQLFLIPALVLILAPIMAVHACPCPLKCKTDSPEGVCCCCPAFAPEAQAMDSSSCCVDLESRPPEIVLQSEYGSDADDCLCICTIGSISYDSLAVIAQLSASGNALDTHCINTMVSLVSDVTDTTGDCIATYETPSSSFPPVYMIHCRFLC